MTVDDNTQPAAGRAEPVPGQLEAVSIPSAARRLGRTPDAIRGDIRRGKLTARRGNDGKLSVLLPPVVHVDDDILQPDLERLHDELDRLRDELATAQRRAADGSTTVAELRERMARIEGEAEGRRVAAVAELAAKDVVIAQLEATVAWHRTPWWRRLIGGS